MQIALLHISIYLKEALSKLKVLLKSSTKTNSLSMQNCLTNKFVYLFLFYNLLELQAVTGQLSVSILSLA